MRTLIGWCLLAAALAVISACAVNHQSADQRDASQLTQPSAQTALAGTAWRLVAIQSMDDHRYAPQDRSLYTLEFKADGSMQVRADCNLGTGSWTSEAPGKLQFGRIAATQALCLPGSLHDRYLAQFAWVRSYVFKDGHLFLATMADGSIVEFEPLPET